MQFLLFPGYPVLSLTSALETLQSFNRLFGRRHYTWSFTNAADGSATDLPECSLDVDVAVGSHVPAPGRRATVAVVSGLNVEEHATPEALSHLRTVSRNCRTLLGFCTGAFPLALSGLLDGEEATIHWRYRDSFAETFPSVDMVDTPLSFSGKIGTTAGGVAAIDLMLMIIAHDFDAEHAFSVAQYLNYNPVRQLHKHMDVSFTNRLYHRHPVVLQALRQMEANIEEPLPISELAHRVTISSRQMERLFRRYTGSSPKQFYSDLRLTRANNLLIQTNMSVAEVAVATGFGTISNFRKLFRRKYQTAPREVQMGK